MKFRDFHRNVKIRIYVVFAFGTAQATTLPFMAIYFAHSFGATLTGILLTLSIVASLVSGAIGGYYADRIGRRKLMIGAEAVFLVSYLAMAVANSPWVNSPVLTFAAYLVTNICWGVYGPADDAMLLDCTTAENRQLMYAIFYWLHNLTMAVGASIGALMFESYRFQLFAIMSVVVLLSWLTTIFLITETYTPAEKPAKAVHPVKGMIRSYVSVLGDRVFVRYVVAGLVAMYGEFQLQNYIGIRLADKVHHQTWFTVKHFAISFDGVKLLGWLQTENTILVVLLAAVATRFFRSRSERFILFVGVGLQTLGYSIMTVVTVPAILMICMVFATVGEVTAVPVRQAFLGDIAPTTARSAYAAVNGMTYSGTRILTSLGVALGVIAPAWVMGLICFVFGMAGYWLYQSIIPSVSVRRAETEAMSA